MKTPKPKKQRFVVEVVVTVSHGPSDPPWTKAEVRKRIASHLDPMGSFYEAITWEKARVRKVDLD